MMRVPDGCNIVLRIDVSAANKRISDTDRMRPYEKWQSDLLLTIPNAFALETMHGTLDVNFDDIYLANIAQEVKGVLERVEEITDKCFALAMKEIAELAEEEANE